LKDLEIVIDRRCCSEKKVSVDDFQEKIQNQLSVYKIKFAYDNSPVDAFCEYGYTMIGFVNASEEEQSNVTNNINKIFNELIKI